MLWYIPPVVTSFANIQQFSIAIPANTQFQLHHMQEDKISLWITYQLPLAEGDKAHLVVVRHISTVHVRQDVPASVDVVSYSKHCSEVTGPRPPHNYLSTRHGLTLPRAFTNC